MRACNHEHYWNCPHGNPWENFQQGGRPRACSIPQKEQWNNSDLHASSSVDDRTSSSVPLDVRKGTLDFSKFEAYWCVAAGGIPRVFPAHQLLHTSLLFSDASFCRKLRYFATDCDCRVGRKYSSTRLAPPGSEAPHHLAGQQRDLALGSILILGLGTLQTRAHNLYGLSHK